MKIKKTNSEFLAQAMITHGDKYKYPNTVYAGRDFPVEIECLSHGSFHVRANHFLEGQGCPECTMSLYEDRIRARYASSRNEVLPSGAQIDWTDTVAPTSDREKWQVSLVGG